MNKLNIVTIAGIPFIRGASAADGADILIPLSKVSVVRGTEKSGLFLDVGDKCVRLCGGIDDLIDDRLHIEVCPSDTESHDGLMSGKQVQARYKKSHVTIWRWVNDPDMGFPQPMVINRANYWKLCDLEAWEAQYKPVD
jgi:predicted DNA-binding transcriptional regulator AlpA